MPRQESAACRAHATDATPFKASAHDARVPGGTTRALFAALTELASVKETLRQMEAQLTAAAHDLRDPLQVIALYTELLADGFYGPVNAEQRARLTCVRAHVDFLSAVGDSVLVLARAKRCGVALELTDVPVPALLADVCARAESFAAARGVSLIVDFEQAPATVLGERTALSRVLTNLTGNAVKFTRRGGSVSLSALASRNVVELRVADTGPGIPPERLDAIFEPFVQLHAADEPNRRGLGLGLAIARDLTCLMGGELFVHSTVGVGSLFTARFPASPGGAA